MEAILNLNFLVVFLIYSVGTFTGILITRMFTTATIFPLRKAIASSLGMTIIYLGAEHVSPLKLEPYGDFLFCTIIGLFAENIMGYMLSPRGRSISRIIIGNIIINYFKKNSLLQGMDFNDPNNLFGEEKEGVKTDEEKTRRKDNSDLDTNRESHKTEGEEDEGDARTDPFRSKF
jgi:hypothetical protein|nr:MAG TPA: hypothetical protein [Caudoviricetes sp.]